MILIMPKLIVDRNKIDDRYWWNSFFLKVDMCYGYRAGSLNANKYGKHTHPCGKNRGDTIVFRG